MDNEHAGLRAGVFVCIPHSRRRHDPITGSEPATATDFRTQWLVAEPEETYYPAAHGSSGADWTWGGHLQRTGP